MTGRKKRFLCDLAVGGAIFAVIFAEEILRGRTFFVSLCNGFFVAAVLLLGIGGIKGARNKGTFDVMGYGVKTTVETFIPMLRKNEKETFLEYRDRKEGARKPADGLLLAGAVYLALSFIALAVYHIAE